VMSVACTISCHIVDSTNRIFRSVVTPAELSLKCMETKIGMKYVSFRFSVS
jgi:hypothetical protein